MEAKRFDGSIGVGLEDTLATVRSFCFFCGRLRATFCAAPDVPLLLVSVCENEAKAAKRG